MRIIFLAVLCLLYISLRASDVPAMRLNDKLRIREAKKISDLYADKICKGFANTSFAFILITDSTEFLLFHNNPSNDFTFGWQDSLLNTPVYYRKRQFARHFLATFPAVNGVNCIVAGTPENTSLHSTAWIITVLHEHFHQYQYSHLVTMPV